ncbi:transcription factor MYB3-like [Cryptomeria japonica]|uniref:transcription factor MYB3-like n=1 Tax=Cryptomeria japonica TaxID=3369 RepID=UPI0027DA265B|nr:transcription factor MYB3-like [Cryptomeria japonica]
MSGKRMLDGLNRGHWHPQEDLLLEKFIEANGVERWSTLPAKAGLKRCGKSYRFRWMNYLRPNVKRGHISEDEKDLIIRLHKLLGNRFKSLTRVAKYLSTHCQLILMGVTKRVADYIGFFVMGQNSEECNKDSPDCMIVTRKIFLRRIRICH